VRDLLGAETALSRRVMASWFLLANAGWQQVKIKAAADRRRCLSSFSARGWGCHPGRDACKCWLAVWRRESGLSLVLPVLTSRHAGCRAHLLRPLLQCGGKGLLQMAFFGEFECGLISRISVARTRRDSR